MAVTAAAAAAYMMILILQCNNMNGNENDMNDSKSYMNGNMTRE